MWAQVLNWEQPTFVGSENQHYPWKQGEIVVQLVDVSGVVLGRDDNDRTLARWNISNVPSLVEVAKGLFQPSVAPVSLWW
jgi:hypothetical protein